MHEIAALACLPQCLAPEDLQWRTSKAPEKMYWRYGTQAACTTWIAADYEGHRAQDETGGGSGFHWDTDLLNGMGLSSGLFSPHD